MCPELVAVIVSKEQCKQQKQRCLLGRTCSLHDFVFTEGHLVELSDELAVLVTAVGALT